MYSKLSNLTHKKKCALRIAGITPAASKGTQETKEAR